MLEIDGVLKRLVATPPPVHTAGEIAYALGVRVAGGAEFLQPLRAWLGAGIEIITDGEIRCRHCDAITRVSYGNGHCYNCFRALPGCDLCMRSPDRCHFAAGTCRDPSWGEATCMRPHLLYLAISSGVKVGLTSLHNIPGRWIDQGAQQATVIAEAATRHIAGLLEVALAQHIADRTDWRRMIAGDAQAVDLDDQARRLRPLIDDDLTSLRARFGNDAVQWREQRQYWHGRYPRVAGREIEPQQLRLDASKPILGHLLGMKGQYLLLDTGVLNVRRFVGHHVRVRLGVDAPQQLRQASFF